MKITQSLRKSKGEPLESEETADPFNPENFTLINVDDSLLTPEQVCLITIILLQQFHFKVAAGLSIYALITEQNHC